MPVNIYSLSLSSLDVPVIGQDPLNYHFEPGTLLVDRSGIAYRARDLPTEDVPTQYYTVIDLEGSHSVRREFDSREAKNLGLEIVWFPAEEGDNA